MKKNSCQSNAKSPSISAFTLVEMLVVLAIVATLVAVVVPASDSLRQRSQRVACASNLRQISIASLLFSSESNGKLIATPFKDPDVYWFRQIYPYLKSDEQNKTTQVFQCPSDSDALQAFDSGGTEWSSISYLLLKQSPDWGFLSNIISPSKSPQFIDAEIVATADYRNPAKFQQKVKGAKADWRHGDGVNIAYWDGSVRFVRNPDYESLFSLPD